MEGGIYNGENEGDRGGKSTTVYNPVNGLALDGKRVLLVDVEPPRLKM